MGIVNESLLFEHTVWKKSVQYLYDFIAASPLQSPSHTVQWYPTVKEKTEDGFQYFEQQILLGSDTNGITSEILISELKYPSRSNRVHQDTFIPEGMAELRILKRIPHTGPVNTAILHLSQPNIIATKSNDSVYLYDSSNPAMDGPTSTLVGHEGGVSDRLDWDSFNKDRIISGGEDGLILFWDVSIPSSKLSPINQWKLQQPIETAVFSKLKRDLFACASSDGSIHLFDARQKAPAHAIRNAHRKACYDIDFNPLNDNFFLSASADKSTGLWDLRKFAKVHTLEGHLDENFRIKWSPFDEVNFLSCGADRRAVLWDLSMIGLEQTPEEADDGPPELIFVHAGHTDYIGDISWNPVHKWYIATVSDDNILQTWKPAEKITATQESTELLTEDPGDGDEDEEFDLYDMM